MEVFGKLDVDIEGIVIIVRTITGITDRKGWCFPIKIDRSYIMRRFFLYPGITRKVFVIEDQVNGTFRIRVGEGMAILPLTFGSARFLVHSVQFQLQ